MFGIGPAEFAALAVLALLILGPDKLPKFAADAGRFIRQVRRMAASAQAEVRESLGPEFREMSLTELDPRTFVARHVLDDSLDDDEDDLPRRNGTHPPSANGATAMGAKPPVDLAKPAAAAPEAPPYDPDTT